MHNTRANRLHRFARRSHFLHALKAFSIAAQLLAIESALHGLARIRITPMFSPTIGYVPHSGITRFEFFTAKYRFSVDEQL